MADNQDNQNGDDTALDPQSAPAAQGLSTIWNSQPVQDAVTGKNARNVYEMSVAAAMGDPTAQSALDAHNLQLAAGSVQVPRGFIAPTAEVIDQTILPVTAAVNSTPELLNTATKTIKGYHGGAKDLVNQTPWEIGSRKSYADGGPVEATGGIDSGGQAMLSQLNATPPDTLPISNERAPAQAPTPQSEGPSVNVFNPEGRLVSIPTHQLNDAVNDGYRLASTQEVEHHVRQEKYGSLGQQLLTGAEGAAEAATFGLSPALEQSTGLTSAEDIRARKEENPGSHMVGQMAGLAGSALIPGVGEANVLRAAGEAGAAAIGLGAAESVIGKIGSSAVKLAIENMAFQGTTEEVSKLLTKDPNQSAETAIADIGLSGLLGAGTGAAFGAISPLWQATMGKKTGGVLKAIADKAGGIEGVTSDTVNKAIDTVGIDVPPEVRAAMAEDPSIQALAKTLEQSDTTKSGMGYQAAIKDFRSKTNDALVSALGKSPQELAGGPAKSAYEAGVDVKDALVKSLKKQIDPISEQFEAVKARFKDVPLTDGDRTDIANKIGEIITNQRWDADSDQVQLVNRFLKNLPTRQTMEDLRVATSNLGKDAKAKQLWDVSKVIGGALRDVEDNLVTKTIGDKAPELLESHMLARTAYKDAMTMVNDLNDRLHVGHYSGPGTFIHALKEMRPEDILRRTSGKNDVEMLNLLQKRFPDVASEVRNYHLDSALQQAASRAQPGEIISPKVLITAIDKMSPEMQQFVLPEGARAKLDAVAVLKDQLDRVPHNFSNTARTVDKLLNYIPGSAVAMATMAAGHNPAMAVILAGLTKYLGRDVPDATRLALLKFLGSNKQIDAQGFKSMFDYTAATMRGENSLSKGVKGLFKAGTKVLPESFMPSEKDRSKLDSHLKDLYTDAKPLLDTVGKIGHYLPEHGQALAQTAASVTKYLNSIRPVADKRYPLDSQTKVDPIKKAQYNRALDIAQQPLLVLDAINKGTLTSHDVIAMRTMYPALYARTAQKITNEIIQQTHKGTDIPYNTRMSVSLFMGQPMDSTMTPQAILAAQPVPKQPSQPQTATQPASNPKRSTASLNKLPGLYQTPNQARTARSLRD